MNNVYGSTWTLQLMIAFILLFIAFLTLTISYSRVFKVKNEVITILEKYDGFNETSIKIVNNYLKSSGYAFTGKCQNSGSYQTLGVSDLNGSNSSNVINNGRYFYCVEKELVDSNVNSLTQVNYEVIMFYKFNIPIFGDIATFTVNGKTTDMIDKNDLFS